MSFSRKSFLKVAATGGLGLLFGGIPMRSFAWREKGVRLQSVRRSSFVMGSIINMEVIADSERAGNEAINRAVEIFHTLDRKLSMYDAQSEMGLLGRNAGKNPVPVSEDAQTILRFAAKVNAASDRLFDVTVEPAMRKWGFRKDSDAPVTHPTDEQLKQLERLVGMDKLMLDGELAYLETKGMGIDLGGIAGGYALDKSIEALKRMDVAAAFINFSGDIHCFGTTIEGNGWPVNIYHPVTRRLMETPVMLHDRALSTSGSYQNRRTDRNGCSWGHLLKPTTVRPMELVHSLTAIHPSAMAADAWSTAAYLGANPPEDVETIVLK